MRLKAYEQETIKNVIAEMDREAQIYLFGSRTDEAKKGGDIDLLIFSDRIHEEDKPMIRLKLADRIGEQKIDLVLAKDRQAPFVRLALEEAVRL